MAELIPGVRANGVILTGPSAYPASTSYLIVSSAGVISTQSSSSASTTVDVAAAATGGDGTSGSPWTGWDTAITWAARTEYRFRAGFYAHDGSTNFLEEGIALIGEGGVVIQHTGSGPGMKFDSENTFISNIYIENIDVEGNYSTGTGTASPVSGQTSLTGSGTNWLTSVDVGDTITFWTDDFIDVETRTVTAIASNTSLTVDVAWTTSRTGQQFRIGKTTDGWWFDGLRSATVVHCSAKNVGRAAFYGQALICNVFTNLRSFYYTHPVGIFVREKYALLLSNRSGTFCVGNVFENFVAEFTRDVGIYVEAGCYNNVFAGGTSESNLGQALVCAGEHNTFIGLACEANLISSTLTAQDVLISGASNDFLHSTVDNVAAGGGYIKITGDKNRVIGCRGLVNVSGSGAASNTVEDLDGTLTNTGTDTHYRGNGAAHPNDSSLGICRPVATNPGTSGSIAFDARDQNVLNIQASGDLTLANPSNLTNGQRVTYSINNGTGGAITLAYGSYFVAVGGVDLPTSIPSGAHCIISGEWFVGPNRIYVDTFPSLPISGGTLTGALVGTAANFTTQVKSAKGYFGKSTAGDFSNPNLDCRADDATTQTTGLQTNQGTLLVFNENITVDSFAQIVLGNRSSGAGYIRLLSLSKGSGDSDFLEITNAGVISTLDSSTAHKTMEYALTWAPLASVTPATNGHLTFEKTSNTTITVKLKGSDGVVRSGTITLS
jgi:hypothetical protein